MDGKSYTQSSISRIEMTVWTILKNLQISLIVLPQALGYDRREAFNGENHHENHLKIEKW